MGPGLPSFCGYGPGHLVIFKTCEAGHSHQNEDPSLEGANAPTRLCGECDQVSRVSVELSSPLSPLAAESWIVLARASAA